MPVLSRIASYADELTEIRRDLHQHPEIGFQEFRTAKVVTEKLKQWGIDQVFTGLATTGVVGVVKGRSESGRSVGLRADMDALPMDEQTTLLFASKSPGVFHGCGHDGHTTMLLGAARYLAETRNFSGRVILIFQPAEEGLGGAQAMLESGLFERFPCNEIYGLHNDPMAKMNKVTIKPGAAMAGATFFDIVVTGKGSHAAQPHNARDPIIVATALVQSLQSVISRNIRPTETAVLSVTQIHSGTAYNVVPDRASIAGTIRYFSENAYEKVHERVSKICTGFSQSYEVDISFNFRKVFDVLINDPELSQTYLDAATEIVGSENTSLVDEVSTGSEDFADMLKVVPGSYLRLGHGSNIPLHNPGFILSDEILPIGAAILARIAEKRLPL